jgi:hypothetical protein
MEQPEGTPPAVDQRSVRPRFGDPSQRDPLGDERPDDRDLTNNLQDSPKRGPHHNSSSSSSPSLIPFLQLPWSACPSSELLNNMTSPGQSMSPPRIDGDVTPILMEMNPESGSITGGTKVWLKGMDFPTTLPLFARFGTAVVPTVRPCFHLPKSISSSLLDHLCSQPSRLSFAPSKRSRCR